MAFDKAPASEKSERRIPPTEKQLELKEIKRQLDYLVNPSDNPITGGSMAVIENNGVFQVLENTKDFDQTKTLDTTRVSTHGLERLRGQVEKIQGLIKKIEEIQAKPNTPLDDFLENQSK